MAGFFKSVARVAAPIVGGLVAGPWGTAAGGALAGATQRGNTLRNMAVGGATAGLGAAAGSALGSQNYLARYLGGSGAFQAATTGIGAYLGSNMVGSLAGLNIPNAPVAAPQIQVSTPSFDELKAAAVAKTQQAFADEGIINVFDKNSPYRRIRRESEIDIYNYSKFLPWKKTIKAVKSARERNGHV